MKWTVRIVLGMSLVLLAFGAMAEDVAREQGKATLGPAPQASPRPAPTWSVPDSSIERAEDAGLRAHTDIVYRGLDGSNKPTRGSSPAAIFAARGANPAFQTVETPASLGCIYLSTPEKRNTGCVPVVQGGTGGPSAGGWGAIALVDAYDNPDAATDLQNFDNYWGLAAANFTKIYANGNGDCSTPPPDAGWSIEESLDIEYAHVYAPSAAIVLVEACSSYNTDLYYAEQVAIDYLAANYGGGDVSNSWGEGEYSGENSSDPIFSAWGNGQYSTPISVFVSAGDSGCTPAYPTVDPWVVSAGGTSIYRNKSTEKFTREGCWSGSGGGVSTQETWAQTFTGSNSGPWADYQYPIFAESNRAIPDFASNSDPSSGVYIYNQYAEGGWSCCWGGTSEASPSLAAIVNRAGNKLSTCWFNPVNSTCYFYNAEDTLLYAQLPTAAAYSSNFYDISTGSNGCTVSKGWDYCTGVGSPRGTLGK